MKIAILVDQPHWTGVGIYAVELFKLLNGKINDLKLIYTGAVSDDYYLYDKSIPMKKTDKLFLRPHIIKENYKRVIRDTNLSDSLFHYTGTDFWPLTKRRGVITIHDLIKDKILVRSNLSPKMMINSLERYRKYRLTLHLSIKALKILTISSSTQKDISNKIKVESTLISRWIVIDRFKKENREYCCKVLNLDPKKKYFLSVGNNRANKRTDLIKIFSDSLPDGYNLLKIGYPINSNNCINLGMVDDEHYPLYYSAALAYIHFSDNEGLGIPLLESLGCELPVICRKNDINKEILGDSAIYVSEDEIGKDTVELILKLESEEFMVKMLPLIKARKDMFDSLKISQKYIEAYESALKT